MRRRHFLASTIAFALVVACRRKGELRCKHCGMPIDPASPWRTELVAPGGAATSFDTPRCALTSWRSGETVAESIRVQEYYDRRWLDGKDVRFVVGGDVLGPMGRDLVPVGPGLVTKFIQDHGADRALSVSEITTDVLRAVP